VPLGPPQISHDLTSALTQATAMRNQQLTVWAVAQLRITM
jgi:hypothetical protein